MPAESQPGALEPWYREVPVSDTDQREEPDDDIDFEREVASAREAASDAPVFTQEEAGLRSRLGWGRSPILAVVVIVVGVFLLAAT